MRWAIISTSSLYLGALNSVLARFVGTCTQGDADRLFGIVFSAPLFGLFLLGLWRTRYFRSTGILCLSGILVLVWQAEFAVSLLYGIALRRLSACAILEGGTYEYSGSETAFAALWPLVILGTVIGALLIASLRARRLPA